MPLRNRILTLALTALALAVLHAAPVRAQLVDGTDYRSVNPPLPTSSPGKIEVIEFFSYACPHCAAFYPRINAWAARQAKDVVLKRVPVSFGRAPWINLQRAFYAMQASGDFERLDGKLFQAIHVQQEQLFDAQSLADWVGKNGGHAEQFAAAYSAFGVNNQTVQADKYAEDYRIESVPTLAVNGKYVVLGHDNQVQEQYFVEILAHADALIARERAATHPVPAQKSKGR